LSGGELIEVEDIVGNTVFTRADFKQYLEWFEEQLQYIKGLRVIDATEGGAKIKGTIIQGLRKTIEEECTKEVDVKKILDEIPPIFRENNVREAVKKFFHETLNGF
jgi:hypothetical protein